MSPNSALDNLLQSHDANVELCDVLEQIADSLPHNVDCELCRSVSASLRSELPLHRRDFEDAVFPLLSTRALPEDNIDHVLAQLRSEHLTDECGAHDLIEILPMAGGVWPRVDPNVLGYMLRSFFECFRRHLVWERHLIVTLAGRRLSGDDLAILGERLREHRHAAG